MLTSNVNDLPRLLFGSVLLQSPAPPRSLTGGKNPFTLRNWSDLRGNTTCASIPITVGLHVVWALLLLLLLLHVPLAITLLLLMIVCFEINKWEILWVFFWSVLDEGELGAFALPLLRTRFAGQVLVESVVGAYDARTNVRTSERMSQHGAFLPTVWTNVLRCLSVPRRLQ